MLFLDLYYVLFIFLLSGYSISNAFVTTSKRCHYRTISVSSKITRTLELKAVEEPEESSREERLAQLGFTSDEISRAENIDEEVEQEVKVVVIDDVDPVTLTAIGFALIAFNFLVFANMGDAGIAGIVARIINAFR
mmetsp:Transcript_11019/g.14393  ORF Transcript_11019/g.14393 Transcript_11019/m.14393 type:complete len:136 (-) Transcript_11019:1083-1490(-)|eukprot:CAMPEP_0116065314 /NCGR_PEP_ID=MMETSP0322-20121206/9677_1 /TAXON_ID=163516 /ORGANISM="Leptocylindrus danicus var. apora, Strain B651" /LENGTH=135 /DNA_ID=CAMNT_0003551581 /DNA_START=101 /DNA_END=508 /DNA_ORIENTATION=+